MKKKTLMGVLLLLGLHAYAQDRAREKIWIDTDIAIGKFSKDVDDGIALIMALQSPELQIEGISLVTNLDYGYRITKRLLHWYPEGDKIPVYKGTANANELGRENEAVNALVQALKKETLTIIALGPATNIATVMILYPELITRIKRIVWCAGRTPDLHFKPGKADINVCDCNFDKDPAAGAILLASQAPLTLSGYEPASYIHLSKQDLRPLKDSPREGDGWLYRQLIRWSNMWRIFLGSPDGFIPFDAVTLGGFLAPDSMEYYHDIPVGIQEYRNDSWLYSRKPLKPFLIASYEQQTSHKVNYYYKAGADLKKIILQLLIGNSSEMAATPPVQSNKIENGSQNRKKKR